MRRRFSGTAVVGRDPLQSELQLEIPLSGLAVDEPQLRALEGPDFPGQIPQKDIAGTRANMLGDKLLQAERFPYIQVRSEKITGSLPHLTVEASVTVRGAAFPVVFPVRVEIAAARTPSSPAANWKSGIPISA